MQRHRRELLKRLAAVLELEPTQADGIRLRKRYPLAKAISITSATNWACKPGLRKRPSRQSRGGDCSGSVADSVVRYSRSRRRIRPLRLRLYAHPAK